MSKQRDVEQHSRPPVSDDALGRCSVIAALTAAGIAGPIMFAVVGLAFLVLSGMGLVWAGLFPSTDTTGARWDDRVLHIVAFPMTFLGAGIGLIENGRNAALIDHDETRLAVLGRDDR